MGLGVVVFSVLVVSPTSVFRPFTRQLDYRPNNYVIMSTELLPFFKALSFALEETNLGSVCFKPKQIDILLKIFSGEDVIGILPTGYGKSLIFYLLPDLVRFKYKESLESTTSASSEQDEEGLSTSKKAVLVVSPLWLSLRISRF